MKWRLVFALLLPVVGDASGAAAQSGTASNIAGGIRGTPLQDVAAPLRDAWLRFHETDLCLGLDAVFVFQPKGMEIWCRVEDEKSYQALSALVEPLEHSYRINLYATRPNREKKPYTPEDDDPLPSLSNNAELRLYLRDPFLRGMAVDDLESQRSRDNMDPETKRRLKAFGDQILESRRKMERLARDLPSLVEAGYVANAVPATQTRARAVCLKHVRDVGKYAGRLAEDLGHAFPHGTGRTPPSVRSTDARGIPTTPFESALAISARAQDVAQRVMRFLYPTTHTVNLADLRQPSLIDSLKDIQKAASDFASNAGKSR
jgi:hypothetical protein